MPSVYPSFGQATAGGQTQSPTVQDASIMDPFAHQQNSLPNTNYGDNVGQTLSMQDTSASLDQSSNQAPHQTQPFTSPFFDPSDPSLFTFDISGLNFGNHYGALEFGMLGHMSSGAVETADDSALMSSMNQGSNVTFDNSGANSNTYPTPNSNFAYTSNNSNFPSWQGNTDSSSSHANMNQMSNPAITTQDSSNLDSQSVFPHAFAIGEGNGSIGTASPAATNMDFAAGYGTSPASSALFNNSGLHQPEFARQHGQQQRQQSRHSFPTSTDLHRHDATRKRKRDPSQIYTSVQAPYSYTAGFHSLTAFLQKRFSAQKTLRIAKALASIRPSFISCTKQLNRDDLIFMEKCFQRTLWEYEDFINAYGTPTVICRRTGEVAAVSKEFSLLTGWRRDVLLGKEPNLNVNTGGTSGHLTGTSSRGAATPRVAVNGSGELTPGRPQPVFLAELLDDDSVIQFYEDFAKLAFGDSRGYVITPCKLLKYKTKDEPGWGSARDGLGKAAGDAKTAPVSAAAGGIGDPLISGEAGMNVLGDRDGKVNCMYCWSVKRDVFDIPMLIVMNVSIGSLSPAGILSLRDAVSPLHMRSWQARTMDKQRVAATALPRAQLILTLGSHR